MNKYTDTQKKRAVIDMQSGKYTRCEIAERLGCSLASLDLWLNDPRYNGTDKSTVDNDSVTTEVSEEPTSPTNAALADLCSELIRQGKFGAVRKALQAL